MLFDSILFFLDIGTLGQVLQFCGPQPHKAHALPTGMEAVPPPLVCFRPSLFRTRQQQEEKTETDETHFVVGCHGHGSIGVDSHATDGHFAVWDLEQPSPVVRTDKKKSPNR